MNSDNPSIAHIQRTDYAELNTILMNNELLSYWQSIQNIQTGEQFGYELLIRGPIGSQLHTPDKLFSAAIENNCVDELEIKCLETHLSKMHELGIKQNVTVNISPRMLFNETLLEILFNYSTPEHIKLELTEHLPVKEWDPIKEKMNQLRAVGYEFWLDDVGCGYFDLDLIDIVQPEVVKLCIKLMKRLGEGDEFLKKLRTVVNKVHRYHGKVLAEGIEEQWQLNTVKPLGVNYSQGYYFDKPCLVCA
ncbi:EAL domain-containing protein [Aliivibrio sp. S3MY1]|uniref:EAL domain-containing protein n=1 Tax=unclassified Aliivibrio TaxID=2645654 RepID=UPI002378BD19|nr:MULTISPECIES: EAL domain-containing protein [unclassified Aliivibrio]MDD9196835.1 EAL domain-containing protein [Aliivibrio sp. S3MY1]MDD9198067.1 EAL domain-containing protein [Aliivibrio sp. S2MY1]